MCIRTVHCRLNASEPVRRHLWHLMAQDNTPLINDLLKHVSQHSDFETWQRRGTVPINTIRDICKPLRERYPGQPGRFYASANLMVAYTYESWLALQKQRRRRLDGKQRWFDIVKSDAELAELSNSTLEAIQDEAKGVLNQINARHQSKATQQKADVKGQQTSNSSTNSSLMSSLFEIHDITDSILNRCAIVYLIKNGGEVPETKESLEEFNRRIHRKQKEIKHLEAQLQARLPKGRDLTGEELMETLAIATQQVPESTAQIRDWQANLLKRPAALPYPIIYGSAVDIRWGKTAEDKIAVSFNGIDKYLKTADPELKAWFKAHKEHPFKLCCDQRQQHYFQRFLEDWQAYREQQDTYPAGLLTLRSAMLGWREGKARGEPWNVNHLALYCSYDTRLMTAEGTWQVQQQKLAKATGNVSTFNRLQNVPERPSRKPYKGKPEILVGLSIGLEVPIKAAVVNGRTGKVLTYRTPRTLLGDDYRLFNRLQRQQQQNRLQRHKNQQRGVNHQPSESELGDYVDRLFAKSIIQLAQNYRAESIVMPSMKHLRELLNNEIKTKAEKACPGSVEAQKKYAKEYRQKIHQWSYNRLTDFIRSKAQQIGISIESGFSVGQGGNKERAKDIAIAAYHSRTISAQ